VKRSCGDNSWGAAPCENSSMPGKTLLNPKVNRYQPADSARYGRTSDGLSVVALLYGLRVELDMIMSGVGECQCSL